MTVEHTALALFAGSAGDSEHLVTLSYDPADPFTVRIHIKGAAWDIDREVLASGLTRPAGSGAIRIAPYAHVSRRPALPGGVAVDFLAPGEFGRLVLNRADLTEFLTDTYAQVPSGTEAALLDVDATITQLLNAA